MVRTVNFIKILLLGMILSFSPHIVSEEKVSNFLTENKDLQFVFLLPVIEGKIQLQVTIPRTFKALESNLNAELLEFIPKTDTDPYQWSEIITLNKILGTGISASDYIDRLEKSFIQSAQNVKVIERDQHTFDGYQDASRIIQYNTKGRDEIVILYSVSGPLDIANMQYALPVSNPDRINDSVQKLKEFTKTNLEIIKK